MEGAPTELPGPTPDDADDVVMALETASALWKRGDRQDAIRWLRRAAESAEETGDDMRALALARAAADLSSLPERAPAPQVAPTPPPAAVATPARPATAPPPPSQRGEAIAKKPMPAPPPPPSAQASRTPAVAPAAGSSPRAAPRTPAAASGDALSELAALARSDGAAPVKVKPTSPTAIRALRVSVRRSPDDENVLLVRLLGEDDSPPKGEKNAVLVANEIVIDQLLTRL